jgi:hypothetical protein
LCIYGSKGRWKTYDIKDNLDHQTATGTNGDFFTLAEIIDRDLESVATWAWVMVDLKDGVEGHVFDFNFVVDGECFVGHFGGFV